ncbi:MAG: acylphosphatase [Patescibacteria group bacterium]|nr:MAG: acylphosphatase [Patescibacteria group bacterium]
MRKRLEYKIVGRVQMVLFRGFVEKNARALGIVGTVENQDDGSVFVVAEGEEERLIQMLSLLRKGPPLAIVEHTEEVWSKPSDEFSDFRIIY